MDDKQVKLLRQLAQQVLMLVVAMFAPVWIPMGFIILVPTFLATAGVIAAIALGLTALLTLFLGVFGIPLLFSAAVTAMTYVMYKVLQKIFKECVSLNNRLDFSKFNPNTIVERIAAKVHGTAIGYFAKLEFNLTQLIKGLPIIHRFVASRKDNDDDENDGCSFSECDQPLYEDESETERVVAHTIRPSVHFPFPKASVPSVVDLSVNGDEIEIFFNSVEELYTVLCSLRKNMRSRVPLRGGRKTSRRATIA